MKIMPIKIKRKLKFKNKRINYSEYDIIFATNDFNINLNYIEENFFSSFI